VLPAPHGGSLVHRVASDRERERHEAEVASVPKIHPFIDQLYDLEKIAIGAYSPLEGFMDSATLSSVLGEGRLPNGLAWTLPILLSPADPTDRETIATLRPGDGVGLVGPQDRLVGWMRVEEKFPIDRKAIALGAYGTVDPQHPNVADLLASGDTAIAGKVELLRRLDSLQHLAMRRARRGRCARRGRYRATIPCARPRAGRWASADTS